MARIVVKALSKTRIRGRYGQAFVTKRMRRFLETRWLSQESGHSLGAGPGQWSERRKREEDEGTNTEALNQEDEARPWDLSVKPGKWSRPRVGSR